MLDVSKNVRGGSGNRGWIEREQASQFGRNKVNLNSELTEKEMQNSRQNFF